MAATQPSPPLHLARVLSETPVGSGDQLPTEAVRSPGLSVLFVFAEAHVYKSITSVYQTTPLKEAK